MWDKKSIELLESQRRYLLQKYFDNERMFKATFTVWAKIKATVLNWFGRGTCPLCKKIAKDIKQQDIFVKPIGKITSVEKMCKACGQRIEKQLNIEHTEENGTEN